MTNNTLTGLPSQIDKALNSRNSETRKGIAKLSEDPLFVPKFDVKIREQKDIHF